MLQSCNGWPQPHHCITAKKWLFWRENALFCKRFQRGTLAICFCLHCVKLHSVALSLMPTSVPVSCVCHYVDLLGQWRDRQLYCHLKSARCWWVLSAEQIELQMLLPLTASGVVCPLFADFCLLPIMSSAEFWHRAANYTWFAWHRA